jgi:hypothetical protein
MVAATSHQLTGGQMRGRRCQTSKQSPQKNHFNFEAAKELFETYGMQLRPPLAAPNWQLPASKAQFMS